MPSNLRLQLDAQSTTQSYYPKPSSASSPAKKQKMSLSQTYRIASTARGKLGREAARGDHNLRLLVGHANLLDSLMVELANAEKEQEAWFNETIRKSAKPAAPKHIQWIDSIVEEHLDELVEDSDSDDSDSDADSDLDVEDVPAVPAPRRRSVSPPPPARAQFSLDDEEDDDEDDMEFDDEHALTRVPSHTPELIDEDSEESDDDSMPPSPPQPTMQFNGKASRSTNFFPEMVPAKLASQGPTVVTDDLLHHHSPTMVAAY